MVLKNIKFAHIADCHLGGWREQKLRELNTLSFRSAINKCVEQNVDFLIIAGDLFNTSLPPIDTLKEVVSCLKRLNESGISVYAVAGSHDFSPSGKTMLDVLEGAGLLVNVAKGKVEQGHLSLKFSTDEKTKAKLTGIPGRKGMLESASYGALEHTPLEEEQGFKIFVFHSAISEYKPAGYELLDSISKSFLPKGFNYYAGGHVHEPFIAKEGGGIIAQPGPLFPNNFKELEALGCGGMIICEAAGNEIRAEHIRLPIVETVNINMDCKGQSPEQIQGFLLGSLDEQVRDKILLIRLGGVLSIGKPSDIDFHAVFNKAYSMGASFVMRNTSALAAREFENVRVDSATGEEIEARLLAENKSEIGLFQGNEPDAAKEMLRLLASEKAEGETKTAYEERVLEGFQELISRHLGKKYLF